MIRTSVLLHLASASPRRREILTALGLEFSAAGVDLDESERPGEAPDAFVRRLAEEKAQAARSGVAAGTVVLGADTAVVLDGEIFGKPGNRDEGVSMLLRLSGRTHDVLTGVSVVGLESTETRCSRTRVRFRDIDPEEAENYWHSGEPADKAGGYGIQGRGGIFVAGLEGSYSGVVGLPVYETAKLLTAAGIRILG